MSIVDKLKHDFQKKYSNSDKIKKLISMIDKGNATYNNAHEFSIEVGEILAEVFKNNLTQEVLASYTDYKGVINNILDETLVNNYELISDYSRDIQTILNYKAGFNIKGIKAQKNQSRISNLSKRLGSEKDFEKSKWLLNEPIKNYSQSIVDDTVKANADFQYKLGLSPKIIRKEAGNCCDWCKALVGEYNYPNEVPKDVYKRHAYCRCSVEYIPSGTNIGTNIHSKKIMNSDEDIRTRIKQYEKQLEKNKIKNQKLKHERIQKDKDLRNIVDKNVGNGYNDNKYNIALNKVLEYGNKTGNEALIWLDLDNNEIVPFATGNKNSVGISREDMNYLKTLEKNTVISLHNHPKSSSFSPNDMYIACQLPSVKEMRVIAHDGTKYFLEIGDGARPEFHIIDDKYYNIKNQIQAKYQDIFNETKDQQYTWKEQSHEINEKIANVFGWKYRREL